MSEHVADYHVTIGEIAVPLQQYEAWLTGYRIGWDKAKADSTDRGEAIRFIDLQIDTVEKRYNELQSLPPSGAHAAENWMEAWCCKMRLDDFREIRRLLAASDA